MKLTLEFENEEKLEALKRDFQDVIGSKVSRKENKITVKFKNKEFFDNTEIKSYNHVVTNYKVLNISIFSRSFLDIHGLSGTDENFDTAIKQIAEVAQPYYVLKSNKYFWVGLKDYADIKAFNFQEALKDIYTIGCGLGLAPSDLIK